VFFSRALGTRSIEYGSRAEITPSASKSAGPFLILVQTKNKQLIIYSANKKDRFFPR